MKMFYRAGRQKKIMIMLGLCAKSLEQLVWQVESGT
jgi:hypothetical protein